MANKRILLIEPGYKNKYPPLGLMKIAQYHGPRGKRDFVTFIKGEDRSVPCRKRGIESTSLRCSRSNSPESRKASTSRLRPQTDEKDKIFVGGIAASLMHERFMREPRWTGIRFIKGLLGDAPAVSLRTG